MENNDKLMPFQGFDWDAGNLEKNLVKHNVSQSQIEAMFKGDVTFHESIRPGKDGEERFVATGPDETGRPMLVVFTFRLKEGKVRLRPISARHMHLKEAAYYASQKIQKS